MNVNSTILDVNIAKATEWDVIIIGSGMGGSSAAYQLSALGRKVLILEKGLAEFSQFKGVESTEDDPIERMQSGKWPTKLTAVVDDRKTEVWAPLGCGAGGSSSLYAAALQRLQTDDFEKQPLPNGSYIDWPFTYEELEPYYNQAESLFLVCGTNDPLSKNKSLSLLAPPAMCEADQHFYQHFQSVGLNPYRLHVGIKYEKDCLECGGHICEKNCKQDANNACLQPALKTGNLYFCERIDVNKFNADDKKIQSIEAKDKHNSTHTLKAKIIILAAGAYFTPVLLQNSATKKWPDGLANKSGLVGRNLMFHSGHYIAFWPLKQSSREGANKTIALRDFYNNSTKYGEFQSTGLHAQYGHIVYALTLLFDQSIFRRLPFLKQFLRIPAFIASKLYGQASVFTTIVEDFPYPENRIIADKNTVSGMRFEYSIHEELKQRTLNFKKAICKKLKPIKSIPMAPMQLNYGHPCGTCKAGNDPRSSVVDKNCKSHDLDNLYIADASFMPTSGGTNPSLTVAANALRVADKIHEHLKRLEN